MLLLRHQQRAPGRHKMMNSVNNSIPQKELNFDLDKTTSGQERELFGKPKDY